LVEVDGGWENGEVFIRKEGGGGKKVVGKEEKGEGSSDVRKMWEESDVAMGLEEGKTTEGDGLGDSRFAKVERGLEEVRRSLFEVGGKGKEVEGMVREEKMMKMDVVEEGGSDEEEGVDSLEAWKVKKLRKERIEREERKVREKEGMVSRGKDMGRSREEVKSLRKDFRDWKEEVEEIRYILGVGVEEVRSFAVDLEMKRWHKDLRKRVNGLGDMVLEMRGEGGLKEKGKGAEDKVEERMRGESIEKEVVVEGGRSYKEVLVGLRVGAKGSEVEGLEKKKEKERRVMEDVMEERERRSLKVEVILDSQGGGLGSGSVWSTERVEEELGMSKGEVKKIEGVKGRVRVELGSGEGVDKVMGIGEGKWGEIVGRKVERVRALDVWAGMVIPGVEMNVWKGKMKELRKGLEEQVGMRLMRDPFWLVEEGRAGRMGLKFVGVVIYVAREGERVRWLESGIKWGGEVYKLKRYIDRKEVEWCTKCAKVGHSWWRCESRVSRCSVCAEVGHTGWQHRCGKCNVWRKACGHFRKCGGCGGRHTMGEAGEGNCLAVRMEVSRLKSLC